MKVVISHRQGQSPLTQGWRYRYDTIRDAILTCARKPTRVSLIYRTETTKTCKTEKKLKSKKRMLRSSSKSRSWRRKRKAAVGRICRKGRFKFGMKERVGDGKLIIISTTVSDINDSPRLYSDNLSCLDQVVLRVSSSSTLRNSIRHAPIIIMALQRGNAVSFHNTMVTE